MKVTFIGAGVMGGALIAQAREIPGVEVCVVEKHEPRAQELAASGLEVGTISTTVADADVVVLAVKPQDMNSTLAELAAHLREDTVVVSIAAGVTIERITQQLGGHSLVIRVMPNTPAQIGMGVLGVSVSPSIAESDRERVLTLLAPAGEVVVIPEFLQDALTAVSGSGPAYLFYLAEAMEAAAIELGLDPDTARVMVQQTLLGASTLYAQAGENPRVLRDRVTSPGGTTAAATAVLDDATVQQTIASAISAARDRGRQLAES